ncbi:MAG TPA: MmcQ/YjbR family DNA-binding protein [Candidatus Nanopelagicales bacterium]
MSPAAGGTPTADAVHEALQRHALAKPGAWLDEPWDGDLVAKVGDRIFAFLGGADSATVGIKAAPTREAADEWLLRYPDDAAVMPYIGRHGWNTLRCDGAIPLAELLEAIDTSYDAVLAKLPRRLRPAAGGSPPAAKA